MLYVFMADFSNGHQLDNRNDEYVKELNSTNSFDADFLSSEENMRHNLVDQIDLDHLDHLENFPMLNEPNIDTLTNNDHYRL